MLVMRYTGSITSLSWIPPRAVEGLATLPFGAGIALVTAYGQGLIAASRLAELAGTSALIANGNKPGGHQ
jgi:hypothetical protein